MYERALRKSEEVVEAMENHPILAIIGYLISKGSCFEAANNDGQTGTDVLLGYGPAGVIMKMLFELVMRSLNEAYSGIQCMGRSDCKRHPLPISTVLIKRPIKSVAAASSSTGKRKCAGARKKMKPLFSTPSWTCGIYHAGVMQRRRPLNSTGWSEEEDEWKRLFP